MLFGLGTILMDVLWMELHDGKRQKLTFKLGHSVVGPAAVVPGPDSREIATQRVMLASSVASDRVFSPGRTAFYMVPSDWNWRRKDNDVDAISERPRKSHARGRSQVIGQRLHGERLQCQYEHSYTTWGHITFHITT